MFLLFSLLVIVRCDFSIPVWSVKGTHYEVGQKVGAHFSQRINQYVQNSDELNKLLLPFYGTGLGKSVLEQFLLINERHYPKYFEEVQGLAAGSGVPLPTLLLLQFADELEAGWISPVARSDCSDIHAHAYQSGFLGHNEDAEPVIKSTGYIVEYEFTDSGEHFTAYTYPGRLPGDAWGFSPLANLTFSVNWVGPIPASVGLARGFINRAVFGSKSLQDAIDRATPGNRAFGFSLNIGDITTAKSYNFEVINHSPNNSMVNNMKKRLHLLFLAPLKYLRTTRILTCTKNLM